MNKDAEVAGTIFVKSLRTPEVMLHAVVITSKRSLSMILREVVVTTYSIGMKGASFTSSPANLSPSSPIRFAKHLHLIRWPTGASCFSLENVDGELLNSGHVWLQGVLAPWTRRAITGVAFKDTAALEVSYWW